MAPRPGDAIFARIVTVHRTRLDGLRVTGYPDPSLVSLELWDKAPVNATPSGYANPWWARSEDGHWFIVCSPRKGSRTVRLDIVAYDVTDEVRFRLSATRASKDVTTSVLKHLGHGPSNAVSHLLRSAIA